MRLQRHARVEKWKGSVYEPCRIPQLAIRRDVGSCPRRCLVEVALAASSCLTMQQNSMTDRIQCNSEPFQVRHPRIRRLCGDRAFGMSMEARVRRGSRRCRARRVLRVLSRSSACARHAKQARSRTARRLAPGSRSRSPSPRSLPRVPPTCGCSANLRRHLARPGRSARAGSVRAADRRDRYRCLVRHMRTPAS
jgi:hypothetical protein